MRVGAEAVRALPRARTGPWRAVRGGAVGAVATALAWAAHVWGGGEPPPLWLLLTAALGVGVSGIALSHYRWTLPRLLGLLLAVQILLHELFDQASPAAVVHTAGHPTGHVAAGVTTAGATDGSMTLGHVLAATATAWVLARGEDWLWLLLELLGLRATRLLRSLHLGLSSHVPALTPTSRPAGPRAGRGAWSLRGPPVVSR
jgi:hypothetical protein